MVISASSTPLISNLFNRFLLKCKDASGAATAPSTEAKMDWKRSSSSACNGRSMYFGMGVSPISFSFARNASYDPSYKKRNVRPREVVLSITSATNESSSPKYNLLPIRIFRAGSTSTSHSRLSLLSSLNKKTSISAPVFSLFPHMRAGKTLVLLSTRQSPSVK